MPVTDFELYVYDNYLRAFENKETLIQASAIITEEAKKNIVQHIEKDKLELWRVSYEQFVEYLKNKITMVADNQIQIISSVEYHEKYGWTVSSKSGKAYLGKASIIDQLEIEIGNHSYCAGNSLLRGNGQLKIGSYTSIGWGLYIFVDYENHPFQYAASINFAVESRLVDDGLSLPIENVMENKLNYVNIGNDVFIGRDVNIMNNVTIGDGCVIGAKSMVTKDCLPYGIYAGTPAKLIRMRFNDDMISQLKGIGWWNWSEEKIKDNELFFSTDLSCYKGDVSNLIVD
jgi:acetyltransferase-like isoleucine patch superfamily enzyme